ncbi:hypothetical protein V8F20_001822 [Naviculisporaceae sp. PSN 640]
MAFDSLNQGSKEVVRALIVNGIVAIAATVLRFWCQAKNEQKGIHCIHPDDWLLLSTTISFLAAGAVAIYALVCGEPVGIPQSSFDVYLSVDQQKKEAIYLRALFIGQTLIFLVFFLAKLTVCMLYRRIFRVPYLRRACLYLMLASTVWFAVAEVTDFCICIPGYDFSWVSRRGQCLNLNYFALFIGILEVLLDIAILVLPIRVILSLQMPRRAKFTVSGVFLVGVL